MRVCTVPGIWPRRTTLQDAAEAIEPVTSGEGIKAAVMPEIEKATVLKDQEFRA
jgi:hypothetical protein